MSEPWPDLTLSDWQDTRDTLHMWTQVVGKVRLALEPMINHWWQVTLYVSARGLTTSIMPAGDRGLEIEFDFVDHVLDLRATDGQRRQVPLEPRSVASFYQATMAALADIGVPVTISTWPQEVVEAIPFDKDEVHQSYDPAAAHRFWLGLVRMHDVLLRFRSGFIGKANTGIGDRVYTVAIYDGKEHGPQPIRGGIDSFLVAEFVEILRLAWLEQGNVGVAGTMQSDIVMIGEMTEELPLGPGQSEINGWATAHAKSCIEQLIKPNLSAFIDLRTRACQPIIW